MSTYTCRPIIPTLCKHFEKCVDFTSKEHGHISGFGVQIPPNEFVHEKLYNYIKYVQIQLKLPSTTPKHFWMRP